MQLLLSLSLSLLLFFGSSPPSSAAKAPAPTTTQPQGGSSSNLTTLMAKNGCGLFAGLVSSSGDVVSTFESNVGSGLTVFCPSDEATRAFAPAFKNLSADGKVSLLLYHGVPVYSSMAMLKSGNGVVNTLATDGTSKNFNFTVQNEGEAVALLATGAAGDAAAVVGTVVDRDPLAVYRIDAVLRPRELFQPAPAPAPAPVAEAPKVEEGEAASPPAPAPAGKKGKANSEKAADENSGGRWLAANAAVSVVAVAAALLAF